jgi:ubiquinone/menaquinone biosynthesis C-methylase UbiE
MLRWFRKASGHALAVSMAGIKLGDRLLVLGCSDAPLIAALAVKVGFTGRACMFDESEAVRAQAAPAVEQEGALVESFSGSLTALPFDADAFDVVVVRNVLATMDPGHHARVVEEVRRLIRPGGRCIVIDDAERTAWGGLSKQRIENRYGDGGAAALLASAGFRGVRTLAEREGLTFVEGVRAGHGPG